MKETRTGKAKRSGGKPSVTTQPKTAVKSSTKSLTQPTQEEIAKRAYDIYLARGGQGEQAEEDWLQAERELRAG